MPPHRGTSGVGGPTSRWTATRASRQRMTYTNPRRKEPVSEHLHRASEVLPETLADSIASGPAGTKEPEHHSPRRPELLRCGQSAPARTCPHLPISAPGLCWFLRVITRPREVTEKPFRPQLPHLRAHTACPAADHYRGSPFLELPRCSWARDPLAKDKQPTIGGAEATAASLTK